MGASVFNYLISDHDSLHKSVSDFSIGNKQPPSNYCPLSFKICHYVGLRLPTSFSQGQVLCPNPKKANQYVKA